MAQNLTGKVAVVYETARSTVSDRCIEQIVGNLVGMGQFLRTDDAAWVTGPVFNVDGGQVMRP